MTADPPAALAEPVSGRLDHRSLLLEFSRLYRETVHELALSALGVADASAGRRRQRRLLAPLLYTHDQRGNYFRTGFSLAVSRLVDAPEVGRLAAMAGELAWTCALLIDDLIDGAEEREGHPCAHRLYGRGRTFLAVWLSLWRVFLSLVTRSPLPLVGRLRIGWLAIHLLARCSASQLPWRRSRLRLDAFRRHARDVNNSTHWSLLAPLVGRGAGRLAAVVREYADAISVNGKMRNDLLDYCGGSTENTTVNSDFEKRQITFPVIVLWEQSLSDEERSRLRRHFLDKRKASDLTLEGLIAMFERQRTLEHCLELMRQQVADAEVAIEKLGRIAAVPPEVAHVMKVWTQHQIQLAEERVEAFRKSQ